MLEARALTKRYGPLLALDRVSFILNPGEIVGYLGPNGSGKSTTVNLVVGLLEPSAGFVAIDGVRLSQDPVCRVGVLRARLRRRALRPRGLLFVEAVMRDWGRIPFTCSYIPGKGFVPQTLLKALCSFVLFTTFGWATAPGAAAGHSAALYVVAIVAGATLLLARQRREAWRHMPLEFEDQLPTEISSLKLLG